jgi:type VI secretion system protein ImpA
MAALNFADLAKPVSADDPCGPDPEADPDFMNVMARLEVALPTSYFRRDDEGRQIPFDRSGIDFPAAFADIGKLLKQSRDIRVLVMAGKLALLNRDIPGFAACLSLITGQLSEHWDEVHTRAEDGDFIMREVALQSLDELATVVLPLQHAPLLTSRQTGPLIFRSQLVASGETRAVEGEQHPDAGVIAKALKDVELGDLTAMLGHITGIGDAIAQIRAIWLERVGVDQAVSFPRLSTLIGQIAAFLREAVERRAPGQQVMDGVSPAGASPSGGAPASVAIPLGSCASVAEARAALAACLTYFRRAEPSSPAVLLIGQAQRLIGKSLIEVIQIMFPEHVDKAILEIGIDPKFQLPLERLNASDGYDDSSSDDSDGYGSDGEESQSYEDDGSGGSDPEAEGADDDAGEGDGSEVSEEAGEDAAPAEADAPTEKPAVAKPPAPVSMVVSSRADAISQMKAVAGFYRHAEPSNPVPLLMDKACALAQHDFLSLLSDILPEVGIRQSSDE